MKQRIVLLDDSPDHIGTYADILKQSFDVDSILIGKRPSSAIVEDIAKMRPLPDAILLDVFRNSQVNTDRTFASLLSGLRERFRRRIPIFALTGRVKDTNVDLVVEWFRNGVEDWIWKTARRSSLDLVRDVEAALKSARAREDSFYNRRPKILVSHGGHQAEDREALAKLSRFMDACGVEPIIVELTAAEGRSINRQVQVRVEECECAVILATLDRTMPDARRTRENIVNEIALCQKQYGDKLVLLLEKDCALPSNVAEFIYTRFTADNMEDAFTRLILEFRALRII